MTNILASAATFATLATAALAGRTNTLAPAPAPGLPLAPTPAPHCAGHANVTAWKTFNGDQTPGLGVALLPPHTKGNTTITGYICDNGKCTRENVVPPSPVTSPAAYLEADPGYGPKSLDNDLKNFAGLQQLALDGDPVDACLGYHLTRSFAGQPVFTSIANNSDVTTATNAAFLSSFWSGVPELADVIRQFPSQAPVYYHLITGYRADCSDVLGQYIENAKRPV